MIRSHRGPSCVFAFLLLFASCGTGDGLPAVTTPSPGSGTTAALGSDPGPAAETDRLLVVATTTILGDLVTNIVGADADLVVLLPVGADPHDYRPSAAQVVLLHDADLVVANGLMLEEGLLDVFAAAVADGINLIEVGELVDPLPFAGGRGHEGGDRDHDEDEGEDHDDGVGDEGEEHGHEVEEHGHGGADPHFWMDPLRVADAARLIAEELATLGSSIDWAGRADVYASLIDDLHSEIESILAPISQDDRKLVTNHDALGYFAARYGFEIISTVIPGGATLAEPSSADLAAMVDTIREVGTPAIFAETIKPTVLAEALAAEAGSGVAVVELYTGSLGEPGSGADTLIGMLRIDAQRIADVLT